MPQQDFLSFAIGVGANVVDQPTYAALPAVGTGYEAGIAQSAQVNKTLRQSSEIAYVVAQFIVDQLGVDVLDNGAPDTIVANLALAIQQAASSGAKPVSLLASSADFVASAAIYCYGFRRIAAPAATQVTLDNAMAVGQEQKFQDIQGNCSQYPITIVPPAGSINGLANYKMIEDKQTAIITRYAGNIYGVES